MKTIHLASFAIALAALEPAVAGASDWQTITATDNSTYFVDFNSIASVGSYKKAWFQTMYFTTQETDDYPKKKYQSSKDLYYFDCKGRRMKAVQEALYSDMLTHDVVRTSTVKFSDQTMTDVIPDTIGESMLEIVCGSDADRARVKKANKAKSDEWSRAAANFKKNQESQQ